MKKAILMTVLALGLIGGLVGGGLFAHFSDEEISTGNSFTAGTIDLKVDGEDFVVSETLHLKPCQWKVWDKHTLKNAGSLDGKLGVTLDIKGWHGGKWAEPELELDPGNMCDLQEYLEIIIIYCTGDDLLPLLNGTTVPPKPPAANLDEALDRLAAAGYGYALSYSGLLKDFHGHIKDLGDLTAGSEHDFQVLVHLQQPDDANKMMGDYVEVDKTFSLEQLPCGGGPGGGKVINLPDGFVTVNLVYPGTSSYWKAKFSGVGSGYAIQDGVWYTTWCIDELHAIPSGHNWQVKMMSSLDPKIYTTAISWGYQPPHPNIFNYVNYLINTYDQTGGGEGDLQRAIWYFIDHHTYEDLNPGARALVDDARLNGPEFVPQTGELALVVLYKPTGLQIVGVEVDP